MTVYGFDSTLPVTLDMMVAHGAAVVRATQHALITVDLPFGSYQESPEQAFRAAARVLAETGCAAVKLEGGEEMAETVAFLVRRGIPVMGHVGLTPQAVNALGGYRSRGHADAERDKIMRDGIAVAEAGAFSLVIEGTAESVARELTEAVAIPTIGIGGSPACDGQILVTDDMLGLFAEFTPKFVKRYRRLGEEIRRSRARICRRGQVRALPGRGAHLSRTAPRQIRDRGVGSPVQTGCGPGRPFSTTKRCNVETPVCGSRTSPTARNATSSRSGRNSALT